MFRKRLFWKIFGASVALILLTALIAGWMASRRLTADAREAIQATLEGQVLLLREMLAEDLPTEPEPHFQARIRALAKASGTRVTVVRADGLVLADSAHEPAGMDDHASRPEIRASRDARFGYAIRRSKTLGLSMVYVAAAIPNAGKTRAYVRAAQPMLALEGRQSELTALVVRAALISILVGLALAFFIAQRLARPLRSMAEAAHAIAAGDFERRVAVHGSDEVGRLGQAFNTMAEHLHAGVGTISRERQELRSILEGMVEGVIAVDGSERIVLMNDAAAAMFDVTPSAARGLRLWDVLRWPQVPEAVQDAVRSGTIVGIEFRLPQQDKERILRLHVSPQAGEGGSHPGAVLVLEDVTQRRTLEAVRRDFIANASHELRTPVAAIRALIETILEDEAMQADTRRGFLERVLRQSDRLGGVVEEMLSLSRLESASRNPDAPTLDLQGAVREALADAAPVAAESGIELSAELATDALCIRGDAGAVRRIVGNLLDNAIKYSAPRTRVLVRTYRLADKVEITVTDRGAGIPMDKQQRVFERFYRVDEGRARHVGGTGLGLAIVKHLVQSMGGEVRLESQPGVGSTFRVTWPAA